MNPDKTGCAGNTMKDVARACGVSTATVSRAFTPNSVIAAQTRKKILETAEAMGCRPNIVARGLRRSRSQLVGMIVPSSENDFYLRQMREIESELRKNGYRLLVCFLQDGATGEREALEVMEASPIDALLFTPYGTENKDIVDRLKERLPIIQLDRYAYPELSGVSVDDVAATEKAACYLLAKGHRRIAFIGGGHRVSGYYEALRKYGVGIDYSLVSLDWNASGEYLERFMSQNDFTAAIAVAGPAETLWRTLIRLKYPVPEELSLIVYDDMKWLSMFGITSVAHPYGEIARQCVETLLGEIEGGEKKHITVTPYIIERTSVKTIS